MAWQLHKAVLSLSFFISNQFTFDQHNLKELIDSVNNNKIGNIFNVDMRKSDFNWNLYVERFILGVRQFILKDSLDTATEARRKLER